MYACYVNHHQSYLSHQLSQHVELHDVLRLAVRLACYDRWGKVVRRKSQKAEADLRRVTAELRVREREHEAAESRAAAAQAESEKGSNSSSAVAAAKRVGLATKLPTLLQHVLFQVKEPQHLLSVLAIPVLASFQLLFCSTAYISYYIFAFQLRFCLKTYISYCILALPVVASSSAMIGSEAACFVGTAQPQSWGYFAISNLDVLPRVRLS